MRFVQPPPPAVSRETLVAEIAYSLAERRGFEPGHELEDWLAAEAEVQRQARRNLP
jgi:hypothetical protein